VRHPSTTLSQKKWAFVLAGAYATRQHRDFLYWRFFMLCASTEVFCTGGSLCRPPAQMLSVRAGAYAARQRKICFPILLYNSP
jgi:hypothetical protein